VKPFDNVNRIIGKGDDYVKNSLEFNEYIEQTVSKYSQNIIRIAFTYVKNITDAEDIMQDTFLSFMQHNPVFESEEHEKAWFIRVVINKSKDYIKSGWFKNKVPLTEDLSYLPEEENGVLEEVMKLDEKYRIPIHLFYYEGYSVNEIAGIMQTKSSTIKTWLSRGRNILKNKLGGGGFDNEYEFIQTSYEQSENS
jgi:RNA polymerase sigma-70 factor (ECF subfamily)